MSKDKNITHHEIMLVESSSANLLSVPDKGNLSPSNRYLMSLRSKNSRRTMGSILNNIVKIFGAQTHGQFDWLSIEPTDVDIIIEHLREIKQLKPTTVNLYVNALRGVFKAAYINNQLSTEAYEKLRSVKFYKGSRLARNREPIEKDVLKAVIDTCDDSPLGVRDAAIISLMANCGLRRDEVVNLTVSQYNREIGKMNVIGKGDKERVIPVPKKVRTRINRWLDTVRTHQEGYLFCRVRRWGKVDNSLNKPLTGQAIYNMLETRSLSLPDNMKIKPHALRRFCGTNLLKNGHDIALVKDVLGHADIKTTQVYIDTTDEEMRSAIDGLDI
ncbi:integrase/recombinase (plasmid) [Alteromonas mediterranea 615]|uniref:Integrase/recombinase n=1 Tax=Alteromonas mediterranea 615 TaxID=1300253 RepID=S5AJ06_9ALTE|nr:integrase/recombinase [Alteromonas mediterranea 615]|tara:strand:+ start:178 stop:1164 length:987 start_codon:yes stop_codon:yes gene_type:complete